MPGPVINRVVADFKAEATSDTAVQLKTLRGTRVVLYFYPKDSTPGCTRKARTFATCTRNSAVKTR